MKIFKISNLESYKYSSDSINTLKLLPDETCLIINDMGSIVRFCRFARKRLYNINGIELEKHSSNFVPYITIVVPYRNSSIGRY
jgi:hypothetical protein